MAGLDALNPIGLAIGGATDLFKTIYGAYQMFHGNSQLNKLEANRPQYEIPKEYLQNQSMASQYSSQGFGNNIENLFADQNNAGLGSSISAILKGGGNLGDINKSFGSAQDSFKDFLMQDYAQKEKNRSLLTDANKEVAQQKLSQQDWNSFIPFQQKYNRYTQQTNSGAQDIFGGGQGLGSLGALFGNNGSDINSILKQILGGSNGNGYYGGAGGGM